MPPGHGHSSETWQAVGRHAARAQPRAWASAAQAIGVITGSFAVVALLTVMEVARCRSSATCRTQPWRPAPVPAHRRPSARRERPPPASGVRSLSRPAAPAPARHSSRPRAREPRPPARALPARQPPPPRDARPHDDAGDDTGTGGEHDALPGAEPGRRRSRARRRPRRHLSPPGPTPPAGRLDTQPVVVEPRDHPALAVELCRTWAPAGRAGRARRNPSGAPVLDGILAASGPPSRRLPATQLNSVGVSPLRGVIGFDIGR